MPAGGLPRKNDIFLRFYFVLAQHLNKEITRTKHNTWPKAI